MGKDKYDSDGDSKEIVQNINVNVNCCDNKKESVRPSAFKAVNETAEQDVTANIPVFPVLYPDPIFDLNNEYDPMTSTFTPKQDGIYLIIASIGFFPEDETLNYRLVLNIRVNTIPVVSDSEFFGEVPLPIGDIVTVSGILQLNAGDDVQISLFPSVNGSITPEPDSTRLTIHFEAARLSSPLMHD